MASFDADPTSTVASLARAAADAAAEAEAARAEADAKAAAGEAKAAEAAAKAAAAQAAAVAGQLPPKAEERMIPDEFGWMHGASAYTKVWHIRVPTLALLRTALFFERSSQQQSSREVAKILEKKEGRREPLERGTAKTSCQE